MNRIRIKNIRLVRAIIIKIRIKLVVVVCFIVEENKLDFNVVDKIKDSFENSSYISRSIANGRQR